MAVVPADPVLAPLPSNLPAVERRAVMPGGFAATGAVAGIKASGRPDFALIVATAGPAAAAAVFTPNRFAAAPVRLSRSHLATTAPDGRGGYGRAVAVISTSGSANAATGPAGDTDQARIAVALAEALGVAGAPELTLHLSTGIIGSRLPVSKVVDAIRMHVGRVEPTDAGLEAAAVALCTTDSVTKTASIAIDLPLDGGATARVTVAGIAKGVGMIHPNMATMLSVVLTDAASDPATLQRLLRRATTRTWNQLTVDGDTSTNDTVYLLASGVAMPVAIRPGSPAEATLGRAVEAVARDLARQQAADGEGAQTLITCQVSGAVDDAAARAVARAVVSSSLVKAAVHGRDPNWGRIAGAAGNARLANSAVLEASGLSHDEARARSGEPAPLDPARLRISIAGHLVYDGVDGGPLAFDRAAARAAMAGGEVLVRLDLGLGDGTGEAFGCDLTEEYVRENSEYTT